MSVLFDMKAFYLFLDGATDKELSQKQELLVQFIGMCQDPDVLSEARYLLKKVEEEILSRL